MKFRKDFVTNSSSSSYVCEICGEDYAGYDVCLSDANMFICKNGHTICESHARQIPRKRLIELLIKEDTESINHYKDYGFYQESRIPNDIENTPYDDILYEYLSVDDARYSISEELCPICNFEKASDSDLLGYLLKKSNMSREEVLEKWKTEFGNYSKLKKYLRGK